MGLLYFLALGLFFAKVWSSVQIMMGKFRPLKKSYVIICSKGVFASSWNFLRPRLRFTNMLWQTLRIHSEFREFYFYLHHSCRNTKSYGGEYRACRVLLWATIITRWTFPALRRKCPYKDIWRPDTAVGVHKNDFVTFHNMNSGKMEYIYEFLSWISRFTILT